MMKEAYNDIECSLASIKRRVNRNYRVLELEFQ